MLDLRREVYGCLALSPRTGVVDARVGGTMTWLESLVMGLIAAWSRRAPPLPT